ncbi:MAG: Uma2 family endonuclease [Abditibacteriales bacterium]|nr:Uma2 family endonuclease [Abditibacteriales bacterium]MDW8364337.1 Uma2 family endonuclease [Abditibacteriales bacterium]
MEARVLVTSPSVQMPPTAAELPSEDGEPLETSWHRSEINLLIESLRVHWQGRTDFYVGGNMFIYFSLEQVRRLFYRGPDFFVVLDVDGTRQRESWVVWEEGGKYPDVIVELLSPSTAREDRTTKKDLYEQTFRTPNYFCYDPDTQTLEGWRLRCQKYEPLEPNERGWLWSDQLGLWLGLWQGTYLNEENTWLRFYDTQGVLVPTFGEAAQQRAEQERQRAEQERQRARQERQRARQERQRARQERQRAEQERQRAEQERQRAEQERHRAERAEAELARLRERLKAQGIEWE